jgi:hypothetical protein
MEILESEIVLDLANDFGLTRKDTIGELVDALEEEETESCDADEDDEVA